MPKKRKKTRQAARTPRTPRQEGEGLPNLTLGPARTYLLAYERGIIDPDRVMEKWPFAMSAQDDPGPWICLDTVAAQGGHSVREAAEAITALEDSGHLRWQPALNEYQMMIPAQQRLQT